MGLTHWSLVGTEVSDQSNIVLGFRAMTIGNSGNPNCGAVDFVASLSQSTLSGPMELYNERFAAGGSDTLTSASCAPVPTSVEPVTKGQKDQIGNRGE
jgi:hypothetical protein